jgi:hypothetical protein
MTREGPGEGIAEVRGTIWLLVAALALVALAILLLLRPLLTARSRGAPADAAAWTDPARPASGAGERRGEAAAASPDARRARPMPRPAPAPPAAGDVPPPPEVADAEPSGIALFPPPGTDPPKPGIIVPDGFELPPGYVRHHQVTDDGTPLPPILMFHPDFDWVDAQGKPIELPANRVVPPDLAPPGMPVRMLEVPETRVELVEPPAPGTGGAPTDELP